MLPLFTIIHPLVDACSVAVLVAGGMTWERVIAYNAMAFALQMPLGMALDACPRLVRRGFFLGTGMVFAAAVGTALGLGGWGVLVAACVGNALFHLTAGKHVLEEYGGRSGPIGLFIATGALGLMAGQVWAVHAAYDWLRNEKGVCVDDIIPLGYSLGSGVAVELAATEQVGGLILQAPYYSGRALLPHWIKKFGAPGKRPKGFIARLRAGFALRRAVKMEKSFATDSRLSRITCPVLIFHGDADTIIPPVHGRKVLNGLASRQKKLVRVGGGGHNNFQFFMGYDKYVANVVEFCRAAGRFSVNGKVMV